jgi:hypothetical protein
MCRLSTRHTSQPVVGNCTEACQSTLCLIALLGTCRWPWWGYVAALSVYLTIVHTACLGAVILAAKREIR